MLKQSDYPCPLCNGTEFIWGGVVMTESASPLGAKRDRALRFRYRVILDNAETELMDELVARKCKNCGNVLLFTGREP